jgi:asparagine N-glycosylation enzyme membrane subunit Stt3
VTASSPRSFRTGVGLALVILLGLAARLVPWSMTFTDHGVRFRSDTDPYYHALRAQRTVAQWPRVPWTDPDMNFPDGARIPWPPLFDFTIAALARAAGATAATPERVAQVAAVLALVLGVALLPLVAWLGKRLLGGRLWLDAAVLVALLPANIRFGAVGAADQHGAELLFSCGIFLAFVSSWRAPAKAPLRGGVPSLVLGVLIAAAFWNWLGSALYLLILVGATGLWHVIAPPEDVTARRSARTLFLSGLVSAGLLAASIALLAPPGALARGGLNGLTALHVAMCGVSAAFGGILAVMSRRAGGRPRRLTEAAAAAVISLLPVLLIAPLREGVGHGLAALSRGNAWYASISEYRPILVSGARSLGQDLRTVFDAFGLGLFLMPIALVPLWRRWKSSETERPALFFLFVWGSTFFALTLSELRFQLYLAIPMAFWIAIALRDLADRAAARWPSRAVAAGNAVRAAGILLVVAPALPFVWSGAYAAQQPGFESDLFPELVWLRKIPSTDASRPAVMAEWAVGHAVQYFAAKPAIVTPFGTDLDEGARTPEHPSGIEDWSAFLFATEPESAESVLARRRAGFVVLRSPKNEVIGDLAFAPAGTRPVADFAFSWIEGPMPTARPEFFRLIPSRLYYYDGMSSDRTVSALGGYRLLYESPGTEWVGNLPPAHLFKAFGVVPGAKIELRGAPSGGTVTAKVRIQTNQNRVFEWSTRTAADGLGHAALRLPYATGANGLVQAGSYSISDGVHQGTLDLDEKDVLGGRMEIDLSR